MNPTIKKDFIKENEEKSLARISKEIRRETRTKIKLQKQAKKQTGIEKTETNEYITTINEKVLLLLQAITPEVIEKSTLGSISKAFRSILGQRDAFGKENKDPDKSVSVNFNINDLSPEDVIKMLNEKSSKHEE